MSLTPKQEVFAQAVVTGVNQSDAYRAAYKVRPGTLLSSINVAASKMMSEPKVAQRVAELREPVVKRAQMTLESHLDDLMRLRNMAVAGKQYAAAISAETARGKAAGLYIDKLAVSGPGGGPVALAHLCAEDLSDDQLAAILKASD